MRIRMSLEQKDLNKFMDMVISKYHFKEADREELVRVYEQLQLYMAPYAVYRINQRVTGVKAIDDGQAAIVAMTLGAGVDRLQERYEKDGELSESYYLDCLSNELLMKMYADFNSAYARFHRRYVVKYHFIGDEIGLDKIPELLEELNCKYAKSDEAVNKIIYNDNITANEYGVLFPAKSVIFYALLSENPECICEGICVGCGNMNCENRMTKTQTVYISQKAEDIFEHKKEIDKSNEAYNYGYQRIFGN